MSSSLPEPPRAESASSRWLAPVLALALTFAFFHRAVFTANVLR